MAKIKRDDTVLIISGKDKGKRGKITEVRPKEHKVVVGGYNQHKRHVRARQQANVLQAGIVTFDAPLDISNVMLVCPNCDKPTRVGHLLVEGSEKTRVCKNCGQAIPNPKIK
jgi:large subunit ribosomal protein L24